jgi:hypothetical protein
MTLTSLKDRLSEAEGYVTTGERHIRRQRELVAELDREGRDAVVARNLLAIFEVLQKQYVAERNLLFAPWKARNSAAPAKIVSLRKLDSLGACAGALTGRSAHATFCRGTCADLPAEIGKRPIQARPAAYQ